MNRAMPLVALLLCAPALSEGVNHAPSARISASSVFSPDYDPRFVADGIVPETLAHDDLGRAWCVDGNSYGGSAWLSFAWEEPVEVAEVVYYGRVSWGLEECFRSCEVLLDDAAAPVATATLVANGGPQRITVPPSRARKLTLRFPAAYGGPNPGAAEVEVWSESPSAERLRAATRSAVNVAPLAEVSASSVHSDPYGPRGAVDGAIPQEAPDPGLAWCVDGNTSRGGAVFSLAWEQPTHIEELVYWGRTPYMPEECWREYEVLADGAPEPIARGSFAMESGPQRVPLGQREVRSLELRFLSSWGGANPGAAEIEVYDASPSAAVLARKADSSWTAPEEDPRLASVARSGGLGFAEVLAIERRELNPSHVYTAYCEGFRPGGGLYRLPLDGGEPVCLVESPEGLILDCDLDWEARQIVFSWRRSAAEGYHLYRVGLDGSGLTQLTSGAWHDYNACWLPDGGIAFCSTRSPVFALCFTTPAGTLHRMDADGTNVRRLSANYVNDFTPSVLPDGRILYSRWEYVDRPAIPIQSLWSINPDGTGLSVFYGNRVLSPASFLEARAVPGSGEVLCTLTAHNGPIRGAIGRIDRAEGVNAQEGIANLTPSVGVGSVAQGDGNGVRGGWDSPFPLDADRFLASGKGSLYLGDRAGRWTRLAAGRRPLGWYGAVPVRERPRPPVRSGSFSAPTDSPTATVYLLDVMRGLAPDVPRGTVRRIRVIEEQGKPLRTEVLGFGFQRPVISCGATYAVKRVWGEVPVSEDGSASFRVPAGRPIYFEALDAEGRAVQRMRSFTHLMPGEVQGCVGCHEPRSETPVSLASTAVHAPVRDLEAPEWGTQGFDYTSVVQPVLDRNCIGCHEGPLAPRGIDLSGDKTDWFSVSYETLTRGLTSWIDTRNGQEANILEIAPNRWGSPASRLCDLILAGHPDASGAPRVVLEDSDRRALFAWVDLNVPYYGTYEMTDPAAEGGRRVWPQALEPTLAEVSARRCASCHPSGPPRTEWVRLERPEWNSFLAAPLAREAGGRGSCGSVFESPADPDYQALLAAVLPARERLLTVRRPDLPGWLPAVVDRSCL